ncbi:MAG: type II toxin-antitoxin system HicA family toxin [Ignavibacteriaceae bacterium]|nr:type II toxin-antitoxin system HicA family toxin [Ignavibacteriaceae bacterium]
MPKLPVVKPERLVKALKKIDFIEVRQKGSHIQLKRGNLLVTVPFHNKDLNPTTLKSILRQAKISTEELLEIL